ncbi:MAG: DinB family protein [Kineosporiaceae bacterium]|nr:DinB family protein [Kineosporiaceae bacterium]
MSERDDLIEALGKQRFFLRHTVQGLTDDQARLRPTVSQLCLGGLIKHVAATESRWMEFVLDGPAAMAVPNANDPNTDWSEWTNLFQLLDDETLDGVLAEYEKVAARTDELVRTLPDLDAAQPLPEAPWFPPGARWSARRVLLHLIGETSQHAGHADILRESIDGQKSMG